MNFQHFLFIVQDLMQLIPTHDLLTGYQLFN